MKKRKLDVYLLLIYSVPYVFLGMLGDLVLHSVLPYVLTVAAMVALLCYCMKTQRMLFAVLGNLLYPFPYKPCDFLPDSAVCLLSP